MNDFPFRAGIATGRALAVGILLLFAGAASAAEVRFERALVYLEHNASDNDMEVRFAATASAGGFAALRVIAPDGRTVIDFKSPDSKIGIRHLDLETPEPRNDGSIQAEFPQGVYRFEGIMVDGATVQAEATLSHAVAVTPTLLTPQHEQDDVPLRGARVRWTTVPDAVSCVVIIEDQDSTRELRVTLPGTAASFAIPDGFLLPGKDYKLSIGAVMASGNRSFVESEFSAAKRR